MNLNITHHFLNQSMPKEESLIWKIGLFERSEDGNKAVCLAEAARKFLSHPPLVFLLSKLSPPLAMFLLIDE